MRKIYKITNIALIFMLIGVFLGFNASPALSDSALRPPSHFSVSTKKFIEAGSNSIKDYTEVDLDTAKSYIAAIVSRDDPTKLCVLDDKDLKECLISFRFKNDKIITNVTFVEGVGYVLEISKTIKDNEQRTELRHIDLFGKNISLDKIPYQWIKELNDDFKKGNGYLPDIRWRFFIKSLLNRNDPTSPLFVEFKGSRIFLEGFRFKVKDVKQIYYAVRKSGNGKVNFVSGTRNDKTGDMEVTVSFVDGIGYVFETFKTVLNGNTVPQEFIQLRYIDSAGLYKPLNTIPGEWIKEINEKFQNDETFYLPQHKWKMILKLIMDREDPTALISAGTNGGTVNLLGFRFRENNVNGEFFTPIIEGNRLYISSGSKSKGDIECVVKYDKLRGFVLKVIKKISQGTYARIRYYVIKRKDRIVIEYAYRQFIQNPNVAGNDFVKRIEYFNEKTEGKKQFTIQDETILLKEIKNGNINAFDALISIIQKIILKEYRYRNKRNIYLPIWEKVKPIVTEVILSYGEFDEEKESLFNKTIRRAKQSFRTYLKYSNITEGSLIPDNFEYGINFVDVQEFSSSIINLLLERKLLTRQFIDNLSEQEGRLKLARIIKRYKEDEFMKIVTNSDLNMSDLLDEIIYHIDIFYSERNSINGILSSRNDVADNL